MQTSTADWFPTGDVATIDPDGFMQITDRSKDVIKSGGEWISSIDLENAAMAHPAVRGGRRDRRLSPEVGRAAAAGGGEESPDAQVTREELLKFFEGKVAKWWIPDDVVFVDELPHTATGKLLKTKIREDFKAPQAAYSVSPNGDSTGSQQDFSRISRISRRRCFRLHPAGAQCG